MLTAEQLAERKKYIGASDAAGVLALSRWPGHTPLGIWADKTGEAPKEDIGDRLYVKLGHLMEPVLAEIFEERTSKTLHRVNETRFHPRFPFIAANLDRRVVGENVPVELKTANEFKGKEWDDEEIPREYLIQCQHTLAVTEKPYMYIGVLIGNRDFIIKQVDRDEKIISELVVREVAFWQGFVEPRIMPQIVTKDDGETLSRLWPQATIAEPVALPDEASQLVEMLDGYQQDYKNLEGLIDKTKNQLKLMLQPHESGVTPSGAVVKWSNSKWSGLNGEKLLEELPLVHSKYYESKPTRRFTAKLKKEEKKK